MLFTWGRQEEGQGGRAGETAIQTWPKKIDSEINWRHVDAAYNRTMAISGTRFVDSVGRLDSCFGES